VIRNGLRGRDADTVRIAVRALGRLERPSLIADILPLLRHSIPAVRAEAANAVAQAAQGGATNALVAEGKASAAAQSALAERLTVETESSVRAAICEAIARLPYRTAPEVERAESALVAAADRYAGITDQLGVVKGFEVLARRHQHLRPLGPSAIARLSTIARSAATRTEQDATRDARLRRLAWECLIRADLVDDDLVALGAADRDAQVRRLAMRGVGVSGRGVPHLRVGLNDVAPMVRLEALRSMKLQRPEEACAAATKAATESYTPVALVAIDQLAGCGASPDALTLLDQVVERPLETDARRSWHRHAHALVALAFAAPERAQPALARAVSSGVWQMRMYGARAAAQLNDSKVLTTLSSDSHDQVANVALAAIGAPLRPPPVPPERSAPPLGADELRRLAAPRARMTIRDLGHFDVALFTGEAPATVLRFALLAESGYYDDLTFDRVVPNSLVQGGAAASRNMDGSGTMRDEVGLWPHVRGAVGIATHGRDNGDAQIFIDLVDNPQFDHEYTVFGQVLNGIDVVDQMLEGDVIDRVEIIP
jgi:peptidyl-prolyl cis-trans isomerase B (cyclophilin B)